MTAQFSLAHLTVLGATPLELIEIAADAGYDYASIRTTSVAPGEQITPLAGDANMTRAVTRRLADTGLQVLDVELARLGPGDEPDIYLPVFEAAAEIGARHVIGQLPDSNRGRATERFGQLCDLALDFGLSVELEFPSWDETGSLLGAAAVIEAVHRPNAGILVDVLHFFRSESSLDHLAALPTEWFRFVQVCDAPGDGPPTLESVIHAGAVGTLAPRLRPTAAARLARTPSVCALLPGGPQRRTAPRAGNRPVRPTRPGDRPGRHRRQRAARHVAVSPHLPDHNSTEGTMTPRPIVSQEPDAATTESQRSVRLGLIGRGIDQSLAPAFHTIAGRMFGLDVTYELLPR